MLFLLIFFCFCTSSLQATESPYSFRTELTWASQYMIDGFNVGGDTPVLQTSLTGDWLTTGLSFRIWASLPFDRSQKQFDEIDLFLLYSKDIFKQSRYSLNLHGFYDYWFYPNSKMQRDGFGDLISTRTKKGNKFQLGVSMPKLIPVRDSFLIPSYNVYYWVYWHNDRKDSYQGGAHHELLLEYYEALKPMSGKISSQYVGVTGSINYHDGAFGVRPRVSHSTLNLVTGAYLDKNLFVFNVTQQWSYEKTVNPENETWTMLSYVRYL